MEQDNNGGVPPMMHTIMKGRRTKKNCQERDDNEPAMSPPAAPDSAREREVTMTLSQEGGGNLEGGDVHSLIGQSRDQVSRVNGKGMWRAWTQSFDKPLLALLDLVDNSVDASWSLLSMPDVDEKPKIQVELDSVAGEEEIPSGLLLRNASGKPIPHLREVLEVYRSSKQNSNEIGENGIGIKHACASLSKLSFVFSKTNHVFGLGIIMEALQKDEGIVLPYRQWDRGTDLAEVLREMAVVHRLTWGYALREYGSGLEEQGIERCLSHFNEMCDGETWGRYENVFSVVLAQLRHAPSSVRDQETAEIPGHVEKSAEADEKEILTRSKGRKGRDTRGESLLGALKEQLPFQYLHLHPFDVVIDGSTIVSAYWEKRLVELSQFEVEISADKPWTDRGNEWYVSRKKEARDLGKTIRVRFFAGFDPSRLDDGKQESSSACNFGLSSALRVFTYSRAGGRLIKCENDPRGLLHLGNTSSAFGQGLTIILDDYNGTLPLNPTKQETAFGSSERGSLHAENVRQWTGAITHFFWNYHFARFNKEKAALTAAVIRVGVENLVDQSRSIPLSEGACLKYDGVQFIISVTKGVPRCIRVSGANRKQVSVVCDPSAEGILRLQETENQSTIASCEQQRGGKKGRHRQKRAASGNGAAWATGETEEDCDSSYNSTNEGFGGPKRKRSATTSYSANQIETECVDTGNENVDLRREVASLKSKNEILHRSNMALRREVSSLKSRNEILVHSHMTLRRKEEEMRTKKKYYKDMARNLTSGGWQEASVVKTDQWDV